MGIARKTAYVIGSIGIIAYPFQLSLSKSHLFDQISYQPTIELSLKGGHPRTLGRAGVVIPLQGSEKGLCFTQLWRLWDSDAAKERNVGLGYRHRLVDWIVGGYGFFDRRLSASDHYHSQLTVGAELVGENLEMRINAYIPTTSAKAVIPSLVNKAHRASLVWASLSEKSLGGVDIEVGGTLTPGKTLQGFLTYYHFNGSGVKAIDGVRIRGQLQLTDYVALTGEVSYDRLRKSSWFAGMQLSFRLGVSAAKTRLAEKMTQMVIRDIDVMTDCYAQYKKKESAHKNHLSTDTMQILPEPFIDKHPVFLEIKEFSASLMVRANIQSILVYSPTDIRLRPRIPHDLNVFKPQLMVIPPYDIQGIPLCKRLKDLSYFIDHSYWHISPIGHSYGISVHTRGLGGGDREPQAKRICSRRGSSEVTENPSASASSSSQAPVQSEQEAQHGVNVVYAAGNGAVALNRCENTTINHLYPIIEPLFKPQALGSRPDKNPQFVPRQSVTGQNVLAELTRRLDNTSSLTIEVLTGIGGLGKTQLAVAYLEQSKAWYDGMFWVQANTNPVHYLSFIEALAIDLKAIRSDELVQTIHNGLMHRNYQRVLWVYDDVPDAHLFHRELFNQAVKDIWQQAGTQVQVLVTSRYQDWGRLMPIELALFDEANTTAYIDSFFKERLIPFPQPSSEAIKQFNTVLGGLPLAIAQAVAYIHHKRDGTGLQEYIEAYNVHYKHIASLEYSIAGLDDYDKTVWTTWDITRKRLSKEAHLLLQMSCFLSHESIAKVLFRPLGEAKVHRMAKELADYSLIKLSSDYQSFSLHVLLQKVLQLQQGQGGEVLKQVCALAEGARASFDEKEAHTWDSVKPWLPHLQALLVHVEDEVTSARLFYNYGFIAHFFGARMLAKQYCNQALALKTRHYGEGHIELAETLLSLGIVESNLGHYKVAKAYCSQALVLKKNHYGEGHIELACALSNLGIVEKNLGQYEAAKSYYSQALALYKNHYGEEHIQLAPTLSNLGALEDTLGHYEAAKGYYSQALVLYKNHYGEEHIQLAATLHNLGAVEADLGQYEVAKDYLEKALALKTRHYGEDHIQLANTLLDLGVVEYELGQYEVAKGYYSQALALQARHYGEVHIELAATLHNLGALEDTLGHYEAAKGYYSQALVLKTHHYGEEHIELAATLHNLGAVEADLGQYEAAKGYYSQALVLQTRHYGEVHIELAATLGSLGLVEKNLERYEAAKGYLEKALALQTRHYGEGHVRLTDTLKNLEIVKSKINCKGI